MEQSDEQAAIAQLQTQQMYLTRALAAACAGRWRGEDSVEAWLYAIDPNLQGMLAVNPPNYP
jgi:hypothetical protein